MIQVLAGAFLISFASVFVKLANVGPTAAMFYRFLFGFVALACVAIVRRESIWRGWNQWWLAALAGFLFSLDLFFWHRSIHYVGPGLATILANFQVFTLAAFGVAFLGETLTPRLAGAIPLSIVGLFLIVGWDWSALEPTYRLGVLFGLTTAAVYTCLTLTLRKTQTLAKRLSPTVNMAWVCLFGAAVGALEVWGAGESFVIPDKQSAVLLIAYGSLCSGLGWGLITAGLPKLEASRAGLILILQPTLAFVWDIVLFARPTTWIDAFGAVLTLTAIYLGAVKTQ